MTTIDASNLKSTLKSNGVKVLRAVTYKGGVILTIDASSVSFCEDYFKANNIECVRPMNLPVPAKANLLGYKNAAEFTSLFQL
jgi:hypothetical protein